VENRNGLLVDFRIAPATGTAERETALVMVDDVLVGQRRITLAADRALRHPGLREGLPRAQRRAPRRAEQIGEASPNGEAACHMSARMAEGAALGSSRRRFLRDGANGVSLTPLTDGEGGEIAEPPASGGVTLRFSAH
jgi:hypothetical protein